jgi:hypothetical protein
MRSLGALTTVVLLGARVPADPWPREVKTADETLLVNQPQVDSWDGSALTLLAIESVNTNTTRDSRDGRRRRSACVSMNR